MALFRLSNDKINRLTPKAGAGLFLVLKHISFKIKMAVLLHEAKTF
jgi:hypothetical protein